MRRVSLVLIALYLSACAAPLRTSVAPFHPPHLLPNVQTVWQLAVAADPLDTEAKSARVFGTDLRAADILAIQLIAENKGKDEYEMDAAQIFGVVEAELYPAFNHAEDLRRIHLV